MNFILLRTVRLCLNQLHILLYYFKNSKVNGANYASASKVHVSAVLLLLLLLLLLIYYVKDYDVGMSSNGVILKLILVKNSRLIQKLKMGIHTHKYGYTCVRMCVYV
jgi:hypothetical protein